MSTAGTNTLGFFGGLASGFTEGFNKAMDRRYEQSVRNQAYIQKTLSEIDIPETISEQHRQEMIKDLNQLRTDIITMTANKKGFNRGIYSRDDLLQVQLRATELQSKFYNLTASDRQIKQEMSTFRDSTHDRSEMVTRLQVYKDTGVIPFGTVLAEKPIDVDYFVASSYDLIDKMKQLQGVPTKKDGKYYDVYPYSQVENADNIRNAAYERLSATEGGQRGLVKKMIANGNPQEIIQLGKSMGLDDQSLDQFVRLSDMGNFTGNTRELDNNPVIRQMAIKWGEKYVKPTILQDRWVETEPPKPVKAPASSKKKEDKPYTLYKDKPMPDGTTASVAFVLDKPVRAKLKQGDVLDESNRPIHFSGDIDVDIKEYGGKWAHGTATIPVEEITREEYLRQGGEQNKNLVAVQKEDFSGERYYMKNVKKNVKIRLRPSFKYIASAYPELKNTWKDTDIYDVKKAATKEEAQAENAPLPEFVTKQPIPFNKDEYQKKYNY